MAEQKIETYCILYSIQFLVTILKPLKELLSIICGVSLAICSHTKYGQTILYFRQSAQVFLKFLQHHINSQHSWKRQYCRLRRQLFTVDEKIPYIGFQRTTIFSRAPVPNQLVSLIVLSGNSLQRVNKAKISIRAKSLKSGIIEQVGMAFL